MELFGQALGKRGISDSLKNALTKLRDFGTSRLIELESRGKHQKNTFDDFKIELTSDTGQECIKAELDVDVERNLKDEERLVIYPIFKKI